jgi:hypothetical protein
MLKSLLLHVVVLWLNGGPGCSSMGGLFTEMGPWRVNEEDPKEVGHNAHTWCGPANMIYLESPIGVGFSYTTESDFGRNVKVNDNSTAEMNYLFMKRFYERYPQFGKNELYLTGESYAGIYVPTLAEQIMFGQDRGETVQGGDISIGQQMNLQGIMVGNGCTGTDTVSCGERPNIVDFLDSAAGIELSFAHQHALISDDTYEDVLSNCHGPLGWRDCSERVTELPRTVFGDIDQGLADKCRGPRMTNGTCHWYCPKPESDPNFSCCEATRRYEDDMGTLNIYGIYDTCKDDPQVNETAEAERVQQMCGGGVGGRRVQETQEAEHEDSACAGSTSRREARITGPQHMYDTVKLLKPHREAAWMHELGLADSDDLYAHGLSGCWGGSDGLTQWLNRDDVRAAIHVKSQNEMKEMYGDSPRSYLWRDCGMKNVDYERGATSTLLPRFPALIERYHVLIFSGDVDACVPYIGTESWTKDVAAANHYTTVDDWTPWIVDNQVGGYVSSWRTADDKEFTFATVYHAGHMVPKDEPVKALALFDRFIGQKGWNPDVSPIVVSNQSPDGGLLEVEHNSRVSFSVTVHGGAKPYIYQWLKDGVPIFGATLPRFTIAHVDDCHIGAYRCEVYSTEGVNTISDSVELTVGGAIATASFSAGSVRGRVVIEQPKADDPSTVALEFRGLTECATPPGCAFHVHESAVLGDSDCASTGGHYSPTGYQTDVWALSAKVGTLSTARVEQVGVTVVDLPLFGDDSVVGRSIVIHKPNGDRWLCATIEPGGRSPSGRSDSSNQNSDSGATTAPCDDSIGAAITDIEADAQSQTGSGMGTLAAVFFGGLLVGAIVAKAVCGGKKGAAAADDGMEMSMYASGQKSDITL